MAKKIRIKDIARLAGVSPGTVDRVLHNRGNISEKSREAVEKILEEVEYFPNIHISALSLKKTYNIVLAIPNFEQGEYWSIVHNGIIKAVEEYDGVDVNYKFLYYDQFDLYSCKKTFDKIVALSPDAVIIGVIFKDETTHLANLLQDNKIPYVYIDSMVDGTSPVAYVSSDHYKCGYLAAKLIDIISPEESDCAIFQAVRIGDASSNTTILRKAGFIAYFEDRNAAKKIIRVPFSATNPKENDKLIGDFFEKNPNVKSAIVLSSRGNIIADYIEKNGLLEIKLVCIDLTEKNIAAVKAGSIDFAIGQRPRQQGFTAVKTILEHLIFRGDNTIPNLMPLDIITQENIDFYSDFD